MRKWEENEEIQIFQEYLRIPSVQPDIAYTPCVDFLKKQAKNLGLTIEVCHPGGPKKPVVILTWLGQNPEQPSIMLNSHMDVVPVYHEKWTHQPFGAEIDKDGRTWHAGYEMCWNAILGCDKGAEKERCNIEVHHSCDFCARDLKYRTAVFPGVTDNRFVRGVGIPALGLSPLSNTPILAHDNDEYLSAEMYLKGIEIYLSLVTAKANAQIFSILVVTRKYEYSLRVYKREKAKLLPR